MPKKMESKNLIVKSNVLIEAKYRLTATEQKIVFLVINLIDRNDEDFKTYSLQISQLIKFIDTKSNNQYSQVKEITRNLMKKVFTITDIVLNEDTQISWFSSVKYKNGKGIVEFKFDPSLKPYLIQLKDCFTQIDISNVMQLKSAYSLRMYELLLQYKGIKNRTFNVDELRLMLGIEKNEYPNFNDFKRKVILQAQKELKMKTDISFEFEEIKTGRKITTLKFIIDQKNSKDSNELTGFGSIENEETTLITTDLMNEVKQHFENKYKGKLVDKFVKDMLEKRGIEHIRDCLKNYEEHLDGRNIRSVGGDFYTYVMKGYEKPTSYNGNKPKYTDFKQREYSEEDYEKFYSNLQD
jgi:plasmid replication initiation protein